MTDRLIGVRAKIERAKHHISDLESTMQAFRNEDPYGFKIENDPNTGDEIHRIEIRRETPIALALIAGDALHNLRSALDHLAWQVHEADGGIPDEWTKFPVCECPSKYEPHQLATKQKFSPRLISLFEAVQPYQRGYDLLWVLHKLNNFDKHRLPFETDFALKEVMPTWKTLDTIKPYKRANFSRVPSNLSIRVSGIMGSGTQDFSIIAPIGGKPGEALSILQDGAEFGRILAPVLPKDYAHLNLTFEIAFRQPEIASGKPVIELLTQLAQLVDSIVNQPVWFP